MQEQTEDIQQILNEKAFLKREFLTWLWYSSENGQSDITLTWDDQSVPVRYWIDDQVVFESTHGEELHMVSLKGGAPATSPEAATALILGKTIRQLRFGLLIDGDAEVHGALSSRSLDLAGIKIVDLRESAQDEEPVLRRITLTQQALACIEELFNEFLDERISDHWEQGIMPKMKAWIQGRFKRIESSMLH